MIDKATSKLVDRKKNLILIDNDVPPHVISVITEAAIASGGKIKVLEGLDKESIYNYYQEGKILIDWCMRGIE